VDRFLTIMDFVRQRFKSFQYAFEGWHYVLRTQPNAWIHAIFSVLVICLAFLLRLPLRDWAVLILTMLVVWMGEFLNTALEAVVDMTMPDPHPLAKAAKDVAAAAVLLGAIAAVLIGLLILGPPLWEWFFQGALHACVHCTALPRS
jgi:diacylglycerol kinase (ATP)